jgi:hypothetical protein
MVRGLDKFKEHFQQYKDSYILIGGAACSVVMDESGVEFRATKDLDLILCVESLDNGFISAFWEFIKRGHYLNQQRSDGKRLFYRFAEPEDKDYPEMLELFSRLPDGLKFEGEGRLTPIPVDEETSSLSAILLDEGYYGFLQAGKNEVDGLVIIGQEFLIPMKAKAYLDLSNRKAAGESIDEKKIKKHKNDVLRLYRIIDPENKITLPGNIKADLRDFLTSIENDPVDPRSLGYLRESLKGILSKMREFYDLDN